jgi:hypothetical protein
VNRRTAGLLVVTLFAIAVIGLSASAIDSTPIESGFGIEAGSANGSGDSSSGSGGSAATSGDGTGGSGIFSIEIDGADASESDSSSSPVSSLLVVVVFVGIAAADVVLVFWSTGDSALEAAATTAREPAPPDNGQSMEDESHAADPMNEVYTAWWEMTRDLDVPRLRSRTPGELAAAAIDAGMTSEAVEELTALFTAVRYGDVSVTADREQRARAALDRLQLGTATDRGEKNP